MKILDTFDIGEVCKMLGTTSRALRYYEEKGIIQSTALPFQTRRQYDVKQIEQIKNVLVLRSLGLSIAQIKQLQQGGNLSDAIGERKAQLIASISSKMKEVYLLSEALATVKEGGDLFSEQEKYVPEPSHELMDLVSICTDAIVSENFRACFSYFSEELQEYLPLSAFERVIHDTLDSIGRYICTDRVECDKEFPHIMYCYLKYEKLGLLIKYVFHGNKIDGIWLSYYEPGRSR